MYSFSWKLYSLRNINKHTFVRNAICCVLKSSPRTYSALKVAHLLPECLQENSLRLLKARPPFNECSPIHQLLTFIPLDKLFQDIVR